jgi:DNA-directed RNA polymerase
MTAQMVGKLKFSDKPEAIKTIAELVAVLCFTDVFDIFKPVGSLSLHIKFNLAIPPELLSFIQNTAFLPPMLCTPKEVTNNYSSGYLTHEDSLVLGKGNNHDGDLCLDVINKMNSVCLKLDTQFLSTLTETPTFMLDDQEKIDQWNKFIKQSYSFYLMLATHDNEFYLTHKVDKRGRIYAQGYHLNTQGTAFKKAMIELANEELVEGVY